jgi:Gpi18-like mannosyltransferase
MKKISLTFFAWAFVIYLLSFLSSSPAFFDYSYESTAIFVESFGGLWHLLNFDGAHYQNISQLGYIVKFQTAFFPLYPLIIKALSLLLKSHLISGLLISLVSIFFSLVIITKLFKKPFSAIHLILFPLSFFFLTGYTESLFLLLSLLSWYFYKKRSFLSSGLFGLLASLSRFYGVLLFPSLLLDFILKLPKSKRLKLVSYKPFLPILLIPLGLSIYMFYLQLTYSDPLAFIHSLSLWGKGTVILPPQTIYRYLKIFATVSPKIIQFWIAVLEFSSFIFGLFIAYILYKQKKLSYSLYVFLGSIIPSFTGTLQSLPRYILVLFPIYFIKLPKKLYLPIILFSISLQLTLLVAFLNGKFVG